MVATPSSDGMLSTRDWNRARAALPIACVDILPVVRDATGAVVEVGLIRREFEGTTVWCHLGGRVLLDERLLDGARRHIDTTITASPAGRLATEPYYTAQFMTSPQDGVGFDPSKHAISTCYLLEATPGTAVSVVASGEAIEFEWVPVAAIGERRLWPGTELIVAAVPSNRLEATYDSVHAEYLSHNELMWQTPTLAMTAMAFLLTISLGDADFWARCLAAMLSAVTALASVQLLAKHSSMQRANADQLHALELRLGMLPLHAPPTGARPPATGIEARLARLRSRHVWMLTLAGFGAVSIASLVVAAVQWLLA